VTQGGGRANEPRRRRSDRETPERHDTEEREPENGASGYASNPRASSKARRLRPSRRRGPTASAAEVVFGAGRDDKSTLRVSRQGDGLALCGPKSRSGTQHDEPLAIRDDGVRLARGARLADVYASAKGVRGGRKECLTGASGVDALLDVALVEPGCRREGAWETWEGPSRSDRLRSPSVLPFSILASLARSYPVAPRRRGKASYV